MEKLENLEDKEHAKIVIEEIEKFKKLMKERDISFDSLHDSVKWDKIKEIKEIDYNDFVYDFSVPDVQNFAAGIGGIITHNSFSFAGQQETYLNIRGEQEVMYAAKQCISSLFTDRAIFYRATKGFDHFKIAYNLLYDLTRKILDSSGKLILDINMTRPESWNEIKKNKSA